MERDLPSVKSWKSLVKRRNNPQDGGKSSWKMKPVMALMCTVLLIFWYKTTNIQYEQTEFEETDYPFEMAKESEPVSEKLKGLPFGIIQPRSDLELKPLWSSSTLRSKGGELMNRNLLAMPVGLKQKDNVDSLVQKFLPANFTVILFHYDGNMDQWWDLEWSSKAIHIVAHNQTKWWFAKRFLHPDIVSIYDYVFLWDEDLGVENFNPQKYLRIVKAAGLEISQPALHPNSTEVHHRITVRSRTKVFHRRVYDSRGNMKCSIASEGPPCTGFVEGMAPVFSRSAWFCTWNLIQNDLVHGWGMDMKLGYCAQGDRSKKVGIVDSEYIFHQGIQTLGGSGYPDKKNSARSVVNRVSYFYHPNSHFLTVNISSFTALVTFLCIQRRGSPAFDSRTEIRRQSTWELQTFKKRWNRAVEEDKNWVDRSSSTRNRISNNRRFKRTSVISSLLQRQAQETVK
ncbi:uncharacterized protein LOC106391161 isoform X2 [Brassica napus]|nr:uncharacterized protein LOC106391161 isoform X2 [Brassica napus]XP_048626044.1 uncharacterized protein LOC106391161 isoform X2 [Brassica napus]XP_048626045.1 uncharacterized protein LOC106391161 isoform X2 [Brassica napus]XP_048626046.1 uncharacterized protein LOC106391161 isoform X2 [Brassica napus]